MISSRSWLPVQQGDREPVQKGRISLFKSSGTSCSCCREKPPHSRFTNVRVNECLSRWLIIVYQVRKRFSDGRGAARVDKDGDLNVSFPKPPGQASTSTALFGGGSHGQPKEKEPEPEDEFADTMDGETVQEDRHEAWRFLLAGGIAGAGELNLVFICIQIDDSLTDRHCAV